uniref:AlNc14C71G4879 protein n=1 Tax=Albugo laibachii Nc14 TaxID=890382 RepID=F0WE17_9STRA|nr:AlNc14C71G4879 [Albugo laibachii Nc14]|eukprot:CCA19446.1 AlNc14C71G4879 [Albugo laibachii Nc14]
MIDYLPILQQNRIVRVFILVSRRSTRDWTASKIYLSFKFTYGLDPCESSMVKRGFLALSGLIQEFDGHPRSMMHTVSNQRVQWLIYRFQRTHGEPRVKMENIST